MFRTRSQRYRNSRRMAVKGMVQQLCREVNVGFVYLWDSFVGKEEMYLRDGLHLKPQSHQAYNQVTTYLRPKNGPIVERTYDRSQRSYDWSQRSWVIAMGKTDAKRSMVMFKIGRATLRSVAPPIDYSLTLYNVEIFLGFRSLPIRRPTLLIVRSIVYGYH